MSPENEQKSVTKQCKTKQTIVGHVHPLGIIRIAAVFYC